MTRNSLHLPEAKPKPWKDLAAFLKHLHMIPAHPFTGRVEIHFTDGCIRNVVRSEVLNRGTTEPPTED